VDLRSSVPFGSRDSGIRGGRGGRGTVDDVYLESAGCGRSGCFVEGRYQCRRHFLSVWKGIKGPLMPD
jgi:hypothetical protein